MRGFELQTPSTLSEAIATLDTDDPTVRPMSGGTGLMLMMKSGVFQPSILVSLAGVEADHGRIEAAADGGLRIGALATLTAVEHSAEVRRMAPVIGQIMTRLSNVRVRNAARIGGNLAHGDPHMDLPPVLASLRADAELVGPHGSRDHPVAELYSGYYETVLAPGELIAGVKVPSQSGWRSSYTKVTTRAADDWPALGVALSLKIEGDTIADLRVFVSAATERVTRAAAAEAVLRGQSISQAGLFARAAEAARDEIETIEDAQGSAGYKADLLHVHLRRALEQIVSEGPLQ